MASVAASGIASDSKPLEWTVVGKKLNANPDRKQGPVNPVPAAKMKTIRRVILVQADNAQPLTSPLLVRNNINRAFTQHGVKGPVVSVVAKTTNNNIAISTTEEYNADFLLEKKEIWKDLIPHITMQKDQPWFKVVAHGIPLVDFDHEEGMEMMKEEVMTFNKGLKPIGVPYWISTKENRLVNRAGSVAIAFGTEEEANRAIRNRLYIAGISARVTKFYSVAPTTQCQKCRGFGHLDTYCRKEEKCDFCCENHSTQQHYCTVCKTKGKSCIHLIPKCINCKGNHQSSNKCCEVFQAVKNRGDETVL